MKFNQRKSTNRLHAKLASKAISSEIQEGGSRDLEI
jgi:hypothetical protein